MYTEEQIAAATARVAACGPVECSTEDLVNPRAFKHQRHPIQRHFDALVEVLASTGETWRLRDAAWRRIVALELLPALGSEVQLAAGSYNSAYARFINGLTDNEAQLPHKYVQVPAEVVAAHCIAAALGSEIPASPVGERPSVAEAGGSALVGRSVEVGLLTEALEPIVGRLRAYLSDVIVVDANERLVVIPLHAVAYCATSQRTSTEDAWADEPVW